MKNCSIFHRRVIVMKLYIFRALDKEDDGIQRRLVYLIIGLCAASLIIIVVLVSIIVMVRYNRRNMGVYKVKPGAEPTR